MRWRAAVWKTMAGPLNIKRCILFICHVQVNVFPTKKSIQNAIFLFYTGHKLLWADWKQSYKSYIHCAKISPGWQAMKAKKIQLHLVLWCGSSCVVDLRVYLRGIHCRTFFVPVFLQTLRPKYRMLPSCRFFLPDILK